jgi:hypothetical protein
MPKKKAKSKPGKYGVIKIDPCILALQELMKSQAVTAKLMSEAAESAENTVKEYDALLLFIAKGGGPWPPAAS